MDWKLRSHTDGSRRPVRIRGVITEGDGADRALCFSTDSLPDGVFLKACGSR